MTPAMCRTRHDPPNTYGDCLRACVATVMDYANPEQVPHFHHDGPTGTEALVRVREWLRPQGYTLTGFALGGDEPIEAVFEFMGAQNPDTTWLLFGAALSGEDHVVVCQGGEMVHNPAWVPGKLHGVGSSGVWQIMVVSRL